MKEKTKKEIAEVLHGAASELNRSTTSGVIGFLGIVAGVVSGCAVAIHFGDWGWFVGILVGVLINIGAWAYYDNDLLESQERWVLQFLSDQNGTATLADVVVNCPLSSKRALRVLNRLLHSGMCRSTVDHSGTLLYELNTAKQLSGSNPNGVIQLTQQEQSSADKS